MRLGRRPDRPVVTVYTRQRCGLCRAAEAVVARVARGRARVELVDIDADRVLTERYTIRVPVVAVDGVEIAEHQLEPDQLRAAIRIAGRARRAARRRL
ncbi:MAG TPA: glutaredoxin family protein [Egibacteraceae bacterium]|nr:glutaredoxin family protein [Egibacteraceae bacterium]